MKPLNAGEARNLVRFIGEKIKAEVDMGDEDWPAFMFKRYKEGIAYTQIAFVNFVDYWDSKEEKENFVSMFLSTDTPFKNRRCLTKKLHKEIKDSYVKFFDK